MEVIKNMDFLTDVGIILFCMVLMVLIVPLLIGIGVAVLLGAIGLTYYTIVILVAMVCWGSLGMVMYL